MRQPRALPACGLLLALCLGGSARAEPLAEALLRAPSATAVLQSRCDALSHATQKITAVPAPLTAPPALDPRALMGLGPHDAVVLRHVHLNCGTQTLSDAWNWYAPQRLTPAMNATLLHTQTPFGRAVADLHFTRERRRSEALDPATSGGMSLQNTAILHRGSDGAAIAVVVERYADR